MKCSNCGFENPEKSKYWRKMWESSEENKSNQYNDPFLILIIGILVINFWLFLLKITKMMIKEHRIQLLQSCQQQHPLCQQQLFQQEQLPI